MVTKMRNIWRRAPRLASLWLKRRSEVGPKHTPAIPRVSVPGLERRIRTAGMQ